MDNDRGVLENAVNVCFSIREIVLNKKIVNSVVNLGTSLELLSDTNIGTKSNNDTLVYNSATTKWENKPAGYTPSYWRTYTLNAAASGVQPSPASANRNGVPFAYRVWNNGTGNTNMIIENKDATTFEVFDFGFVFGIKKTGFY